MYILIDMINSRWAVLLPFLTMHSYPRLTECEGHCLSLPSILIPWLTESEWQCPLFLPGIHIPWLDQQEVSSDNVCFSARQSHHISHNQQLVSGSAPFHITSHPMTISLWVPVSFFLTDLIYGQQGVRQFTFCLVCSLITLNNPTINSVWVDSILFLPNSLILLLMTNSEWVSLLFISTRKSHWLYIGFHDHEQEVSCCPLFCQTVLSHDLQMVSNSHFLLPGTLSTSLASNAITNRKWVIVPFILSDSLIIPPYLTINSLWVLLLSVKNYSSHHWPIACEWQYLSWVLTLISSSD